jgi:hypothetical protein
VDTVKDEFGCLQCFFLTLSTHLAGKALQDVLPVSTQKKGVGVGNNKSLGVQE